MRTFDLVLGVQATYVDGPGSLRDEVDAVTDALIGLEDDRVRDTAIGLTLTPDGRTGLLEIELVVTADTFDEAVAVASTRVRTAIHAAGGTTPGWGAEAGPEHAGFVTLPASIRNRDHDLVSALTA